MNPPTEQLIRDYLNRVSVAALGRLSSEERREFITRTREELERETRYPGGADTVAVARLLDGLGRPEALVELERERLTLVQDEPVPAVRRLRRLVTRPAAWLASRPDRRPDESPPPPPEQDLISRMPLTGEIKVTSRPITARRRPAQPLQPRPSRPSGRTGASRRPARSPGGTGSQPPGSAPGDAAPDAGTGPAGTVPAGTTEPAGTRSAGPESAGPESAGPESAGPESAGPGSAGAGPGSGAASGAGQEPGPAGPAGGDWERFVGMLGGKPAPAEPAGPAAVQRGPERPDTPAGRVGPPPGTRRLVGVPETGSGAAMDGDTAAGALTAAASRAGRAAVAFARRQPVEAAALVLLGLGGLIFPPVWLLGVVVALLSRLWDFRDKWLGLAGPPLLMIAGTIVVVAVGGKHGSIGAYAHEAWVAADYLSRIVAVASAVFLGLRARPERRQPPVPPWDRSRRI